MQILHLISVTFWCLVAAYAFSTYRALRDFGVSKREVTAITILLLSTLNATRALLSFILDLPPKTFSGQVLLEYFHIGSSVFQLLLSIVVLKYIRPKQ